jgi:putative membrane protein
VDSFTRGLVLTLAILGLVALSGPFMMGGMMGPGWMGPDMIGEGGWHGGMVWGLGGLTMLAFWGLLIVGVVLLIRLLDRREAPPTPKSESAVDIVRRRYASGELTREQYEQMHNDLEER